MPTDIATEIDDLQTMTTGELAERYEELHGQPCRTRHRAYLIRKIAWRIQANAEGDLSERARKRAAELANDADVRVMAPKTLICPPQPPQGPAVTRAVKPDHPSGPRLPAPGSAIVRQYKGRSIRVVVLEDDKGFEYQGERYRTLSAVAKLVTGSRAFSRSVATRTRPSPPRPLKRIGTRPGRNWRCSAPRGPRRLRPVERRIVRLITTC